MIVPITSLILFLLFCSFTVCLPISWITNFYFMSHFIPKFSINETSIFFIFLGVVIGLLLAFSKDWINLLLGVFSKGEETSKRRQVAIFNLIALTLMTVTAILVGFGVKNLFYTYIEPQFYVFVVLIGLLISYLLLKAIISFGVEKTTEIYRMKFSAFFFVGIFLGITIIPGIIAIIPVLAIFRAYGISLYQSIRFFFLSFTIVLIVALATYGFKIEITELIAYNIFALIGSTVLTITATKWFHIFASDSIKVFKFFKWILFFQILLVILWFL